MTTGRINQVNGGIHRENRPITRVNRHGGPKGPAFDMRDSRRLSIPTVAGGAVPRTLGRRTRSVSRLDTPHAGERASEKAPSSKGRGIAGESDPRDPDRQTPPPRALGRPRAIQGSAPL